MDTKSKSFSFNIVLKTLATLLLTFLIYIAIALAAYLIHNSDYISENHYYSTYNFNAYINRAFYSIAKGDNEAVKQISSSLRYSAYDANDQLLEDYSNATISVNTFNQNSYGFIYYRDTSSGQSDIEYPKNTAMSSYENSPYIFEPTLDNILTENDEITKVVVLFDYRSDTGKMGQDFIRYYTFKSTQHIAINLLIASLIVGVLLGVYLIGVTGQKRRGGEVTLHWFDYIWIEGLVLLMFSIAFVVLNMHLLPLFPLSYRLTDASLFDTILSPSIYYPALLLTIVVSVLFQFLLSLVRSIKAKQLLNRSIIWCLLCNFFSLFSIKHWDGVFQAKFVFYLLGYTLVNIVLGVITFYGSSKLAMLGLILLMIFNGFVIHRFTQHLKALKRLVIYANHSAKGQELNNINYGQLTPMFYDFADDLTAMNSGLNVAIDKAVNNERMRSELITNVTHDLKNPLTSIISYTDLLQKEAIDNQTANDYIEVISEKSNRLKELIDHLVEASKVSSGVSEIKRESLDLIALGKQLEGEYQEALAEKQLQFVLQSNVDKALIETDATYYTRILDNLFSNILKYAMPGTRVYCNIEDEGNYHRLCLKNISNHPLEISTDELTERFVRGDKARTSEGNGLGLGIAKSIALALGAELELFIDGDLFKACLKHPKAPESSENKSE